MLVQPKKRETKKKWKLEWVFEQPALNTYLDPSFLLLPHHGFGAVFLESTS